MKKILLAASLLLGITSNAFAANLVEVYQQALCSDLAFRQAVDQRLSDKQGVPISLSALLPMAGIMAQPSLSRSTVSGNGSSFLGSNTLRGYAVNLTLTQTVFDFGKFANLIGARALSKQADATLNAALQDLMLRVARAYFAVLNDEDNLRYTIAAKKAYAKQLDQVTQQYHVGLKTVTEVYTAKASYDSSEADYITAINTLQDDKENLRVITGVLYPSLSKLSEDFPYITPKPSNIEDWVEIAQRQNWSIKATQYAASASRQNVKQQFSGHLPNLIAQGNYGVSFTHVISNDLGGSSVTAGSTSSSPELLPIDENIFVTGVTRTQTVSGNLTLNIPLVQGGYVVASTRKAQYDYRIAISQFELQVRKTINNARQSYLNIMSGISKIKADKQTIKSSISSLEGMQAAYDVGTETLVDVLNQQQKLYKAQTQYAADRYAYVNSLLELKAAAGTLSIKDLEAINSWLTKEH
jgi:outer membrane protein